MAIHSEMTGDELHEPKPHKDSHVDGTDDIRDATAAQKGLMTAAYASKVDGIEASADVTDAVNIASSIHGVDSKTPPVDADEFGIIDSAASNVLKKLTWANLKATILSYLQALATIAFTGTVTGGMAVVEQAASDTLTAAECRGTRVTNYGQAAENTQTCPAAAANLSFIVQIETSGAGAFHLKAGAGDKFYFDDGGGTVTALDDADKISFATPAVGDCLVVNSIRTGASSYDWLAVCTRGTATDGGA